MPTSAPHACDFRHWGLLRSPLWGHEACEGCAEMGLVTHAVPTNGSLGGTLYSAQFERCADMGAVAHAITATRAFGGASYHAGATTGALGGAPCGTTERVRGAPK
eukprot:5925985-Pyramimonas_sp.AAC.1